MHEDIDAHILSELILSFLVGSVWKLEVDVALLIGNYSNVRFEILVVVNVKITIFQLVAYNGVNMYLCFRGRVAS